MRVIYLSCIPLTDKVAQNWYLDYLLAVGVEVEFWDITRLLRGDVIEHRRRQANYIREIVDFPALENAIVGDRETVFVLLLPRIWQFRKVFRLLAQNRCKTVILKWGALPLFDATSRTSLARLLRSPRVLLSKIRNRIHGFILSRHWYTQPYDLVFAAGQVMLSKPETAHKIVPIGLFDYDQFAQNSQAECLIEGRYAIFLDNYMPFHSDHALTGMQPLNPEIYYAELHRFFSVVERRLGLEIVIAAHPRAHYSNNEFKGRKVIAEKTLELTRNAELVVFHASTSVSYAVLNRKPVWAIYTDEMAQLYPHSYMQFVRAMASYLEAPLLNASHIDEAALPTLAPPNEARYAAYKRDFLVTPGIEGGQSKEIFLREIMSLHN